MLLPFIGLVIFSVRVRIQCIKHYISYLVQLCGFDVVWVQYPNMLCWFQAMKVGWGSSSYARLPYMGPMDWFKEASSFDFEQSSNIQLRLKIFFLSCYLCLAQRLIWIYNFYVNHIAICMCNSLKCWFKYPLPQML